MNRNRNIQYFFAAIMVIAAITGCYYDKEELLYPGSTAAVDCSTVQAKFGADVLPVISAKCATSGCHNGSASGGLVLQDYGQISGKRQVKRKGFDRKNNASIWPVAAFRNKHN